MSNRFEKRRDDVVNLFPSEQAGLLVLDIQEKLWPLMAGRAVQLKYTLQAIAVAGHLGLPIIVTEQYVKGLGPTIPEVKARLEQLDAYRPIEKRAFSCFLEPVFVEAIEDAGIETLAVVGIETHICVLQTILDGLDRGLHVICIAEACASRLERHKEEAIIRARRAGALVESVEMFAFKLLKTADHPAFKRVQKVIV